MSGTTSHKRRIQELTAVYEAHKKQLSFRLKGTFKDKPLPAEDLIQDAFVEALEQANADGPLPDDLCAWLWTVAYRDALDWGRRWEHLKASADALVESHDQSALAARRGLTPPRNPANAVAEKERRDRQVRLLSDIFYQYCRHCEQRPVMLKQKEIFERFVRGLQTNPEIAAAMGIPKAHVETAKNRAGQWLSEQIRMADVHRSVFLTWHRQFPEDTADRELRQQALIADRTRCERPAKTAAVERPLPPLKTWFDVIWYATDHMRSFCPQPDRLSAYAQNQQGENLSDVRYHVEESGCQACSRKVDVLHAAQR